MRPEKKHVPEALQVFFRDHPRIALAFSGGSDSAYLLYAAKACGAEVRAYFAHSAFQPEFEMEDARRLASELDCKLRILSVDVLSDEKVRSNPAERCYHCKRALFSALLSAARADGFDRLMDGTNFSDDASDRPGMRALQEMEILSPLRSCGIGKAQLRELSRAAGLFTWRKPAYACLATRIPAGKEISKADLLRIERGEAALARLGFTDFRLRITDRGARIELCEGDMDRIFARRREVLEALAADFSEITLNLQPRKGA